MLYLDNAATSRFKPPAVIESVLKDLGRSSNAGRSGHKDAIEAGLKIEKCREYLLSAFHAEGYDVIFTKSCTEALNLAIFGIVKGGERVVTTEYEHNSVLRPLFELERRGKITLTVVEVKDGEVDIDEYISAVEHADIAVFGGVCNVTGDAANFELMTRLAKQKGVTVIMDGAQCVPYFDIDMSALSIDMLAVPAHKGLHGIAGTGFLLKSKDTPLAPLIYGGTGTFSSSVYQPAEAPEGYEAGTLFAGGIDALREGAEWSFLHRDAINKNNLRLTKALLYNLKTLGLTSYSPINRSGIVAFNIKDTDSSLVAELLDDEDIAVRSGLHCAPLVHRRLGTLSQGAVRVSFGVESTQKDVLRLSNVLEKIRSKS